MPEVKDRNVNIKLEMLGGFSAGVVGTVIGYPLDLVKTRMQTTSQGGGFLGAGARILRSEGILALYKGMTPPLISLAILNTANFASYNYFRNMLESPHGQFDVRNFVAGSLVAPFGSTISTVEHMIKTQMQLDNVGDKRYRGSLHCLQTIMKERGWKVIYTGHAVNTAREGIFLGTYFYTYEGLRTSLQGLLSHQNEDYSSVWAVPIAGGIAGAWAWFVSFPLDCIKAGIQGQKLSNLQTRVTSPTGFVMDTTRKLKAMDVLKKLLKSKGWRGLYAGVTPSIARAFIVSGCRFSSYEFAVRTFGVYLQ